MKKIVLALGSALMFFAATNVHAEETMSFGAKLGPSLFFPSIKDGKQGELKFKGKTNMFLAGGLFFEYMLAENMSVGAELGYSRKGFVMCQDTPKADKNENTEASTTDKKKEVIQRRGRYVHALDIDGKFSFFPMNEEGGLALFIGPKVYFALAETLVGNKGGEKVEKENKDNKEKPKKIMNSFNYGITVGAEYEIAETGVFVGANYEHFFGNIFNDSKEAKGFKKSIDKQEGDKFSLNGVQVFVGFDVASLL